MLMEFFVNSSDLPIHDNSAFVILGIVSFPLSCIAPMITVGIITLNPCWILKKYVDVNAKHCKTTVVLLIIIGTIWLV